MIDFDIKRGHFKNIDGKVGELMDEYFGSHEEKGGWLVSCFHAMDPIRVQVKGAKQVLVDISTKKEVTEEEAVATIKAKNGFLEALTGFNSKERKKIMEKKAKKGEL